MPALGSPAADVPACHSLLANPQDMREECSKHGSLKRVIIPRPTPAMPNPPGVAKVRRAVVWVLLEPAAACAHVS